MPRILELTGSLAAILLLAFIAGQLFGCEMLEKAPEASIDATRQQPPAATTLPHIGTQFSPAITAPVPVAAGTPGMTVNEKVNPTVIIPETPSPAEARWSATPAPAAVPPIAVLPPDVPVVTGDPPTQPALSDTFNAGAATIDQGVYDGPEYSPFPVRGEQLVIVNDVYDTRFLYGQDYRGNTVYHVTSRAYDDIGKLDFRKYFVLIAFLSDDYAPYSSIRISSISPARHDIVVSATVTVDRSRRPMPVPGFPVSFHAIRLERRAFTQGYPYRFFLVNEKGDRVSVAQEVVNPGDREVLPKPVDFEVVVNVEEGGSKRFTKRGPELAVITQIREAEPIIDKEFILPSHWPLIVQNDYADSIMIVVFRGMQGGTGFVARVKKIVQVGNAVVLKALFTVPFSSGQIVQYPYQIIRVKKRDLAHYGQLTFWLTDQAGLVETRSAATVPPGPAPTGSYVTIEVGTPDEPGQGVLFNKYVPILVKNVYDTAGLGSASVRIFYDSKVIRVDRVHASFGIGRGLSLAQIDDGVISIAWDFNPPLPAPLYKETLALIEIAPIGKPGGPPVTAAFKVSIVSVRKGDGSETAGEAIGSTITIRGY